MCMGRAGLKQQIGKPTGGALSHMGLINGHLPAHTARYIQQEQRESLTALDFSVLGPGVSVGFRRAYGSNETYQYD